jgi:putative endopeptidase
MTPSILRRAALASLVAFAQACADPSSFSAEVDARDAGPRLTSPRVDPLQNAPTNTVPTEGGTPPDSAPAFPGSGVLREPSVTAALSPCDDFYAYVCSEKMEALAQAGSGDLWSTMTEVGLSVLAEILENLAQKSGSKSTAEQRASAYYRACMDTPLRRDDALAPLASAFARIDAMGGAADVLRVAAELHALGLQDFLQIDLMPAPQNGETLLPALGVGGYIGPPESYASSVVGYADGRATALAEMGRALRAAGLPAQEAEVVFAMEAGLALAVPPREARWLPASFQALALPELRARLPAIDWDGMTGQLGLTTSAPVLLVFPDAWQVLATMLSSHSLDDWKAFLRWCVVAQAMPYLPDAYQTENLLFAQLRESPSPDRAQFCAARVGTDLYDSVSDLLEPGLLTAEDRAHVMRVFELVRRKLGERLRNAAFMDAASREGALRKLDAVTPLIAYPREPTSLDAVSFEATDFLESYLALSRRREASMLGLQRSAPDPIMWPRGLSPAIASAYYSPFQNQVIVTAGFINSAVVDQAAEPAWVLARAGIVLSHELTHAFDSAGRLYDGRGAARDWWSSRSASSFDQEAQCLVTQYDSYVAAPDTGSGPVHTRGRATLGENIADLGGLRTAYAAFEEVLATVGAPHGDSGFSPAQRFFIWYADLYCSALSPTALNHIAQTDTHAVPEQRVNGVLVNMPEFARAFGCVAGTSMNPAGVERCGVW